ncbi:small cell adhesion glycoprotein isoform X2 [Hippopotamus amphibius kiboko]|uniref:small cell adhesion glycoprotein isoform X2 n=1 Tax=Hippopotamus amphibius kiboko TaxID=575201 RepID=UPI002596A582|nr:small cell adhesion glycoprotein isoform X2 [Hippopotamus amphibius kiboko]
MFQASGHRSINIYVNDVQTQGKHPRPPRQRTLRVPAPLPQLAVPAGPRGARPRRAEEEARRGAGPSPAARPTDLHLPAGAGPPAAMTSLATTPSPGEELVATPILQATEALSPEAEASTALIAVVITVVFLTLLSVVILIFFYLYKNKGSYVTYEPAEGEPGAVLQMESDSAKGREKEEYFI